MTLVELMLVAFLAVIILTIVWRVFSQMLRGSRQGFDTLTVLQEESVFLCWLKHDLRSLIVGTAQEIPGPVLADTATGTASIGFYSVRTADDAGRPLPVFVSYSLEASPRRRRLPDGREAPLYSVRRLAGSTSTHRFMDHLVGSLRLTLLDRAAQPLPPARGREVRKVRVELETQGSELLAVTLSIYSPYLAGELASAPAEVWYPNYFVSPARQRVSSETFDEFPLETEDFEIIPGARGLALGRE